MTLHEKVGDTPVITHPADLKVLLATRRVILCKALERHSWIVNTQLDPAIGVCERCGARREWPA